MSDETTECKIGKGALPRGHAHVYARKHVNTDEIIPARYLNDDTMEALAKHAMEDIDPNFVSRVRQGDIVVASEDFGCGSSREHAVWALQGAGVSAVVADSFARIFFRNCINNGMPAIECPGLSSKVSQGDELEICLSEGVVKNLDKGEEYVFTPVSEFAMEMLDSGGLLNHIQKTGGLK